VRKIKGNGSAVPFSVLKTAKSEHNIANGKMDVFGSFCLFAQYKWRFILGFVESDEVPKNI